MFSNRKTIMLRNLILLTVCCLLTSIATAGVIPVITDPGLPDARPDSPVRFGVPFPRGVLATDQQVQVIDDQQAIIPHQARVLATWDPTGNDGVRWLLVDFRANASRQYHIRFGDDLKNPQDAGPAIAELVEGKIRLNTGPLKGVIPTTNADLFGELHANNKPVATDADQDKRFAGFFVEHETRGLFRVELDPSPTVVLEETGPIHAVVKLDGWYTSATGEQFCRYSIRAHFYKGRSDIKLDHTFIFTGQSKDDRIRNIGLQIPRFNGQRGYIWGEIDTQDAVAMRFESNAKVVQDSPNHDTIELLSYLNNYPTNGGNPTKLAGRSSGSLMYNHLTMALRDAWQQYPWGIEVKNGVVQMQFWPSGERLLDTSFDGYWWFLNEHQKRTMLSFKRGARNVPIDEWIATYRNIVNATGVAKTHELWLTFDDTGYNGGELQRQVAHPFIACADPKWMTATRALDFCAQTPRDDVNFPDEERHLDTVYNMLQQLTDASHWYGWWDWGGSYQLPGYPTGSFKDTHSLETWHRNRPKSHYGEGQIPWLQYFRTADRKWLRYAHTYTLYSSDRAHVHHGPNTGFEYHYDNSDIHWVGGYVKPDGPQLSSNLQQKDDYVYMYWLTGDRHALDVLESWGQAVLAVAPNHRDAYFKWKPGFAQGNDIRNAGQQLNRLMMLYQATWDQRYLDLAKTVADAFAEIKNEEDVARAELTGHGPNSEGWLFHDAAGWAYEGLWFYYNVTKDPRIKQTLLAFIDRSVNYSSLSRSFSGMRARTYGYELTGDTAYLDMIRARMDEVVASGVSTGSTWIAGNVFTTSALPRGMGTLASAPQAWRSKNLPTHVLGKTLVYRYVPMPYNPGYTAPGEACFNETVDRAWKFRLHFTMGGQWQVLKPDGSVAYESPMFNVPYNRSWIDVEIPADGQTGTYVLRCSKWDQKPTASPEACVISSDLPVVVMFTNINREPLALTDPPIPVLGRSLYFKPSGAGDLRVHLIPAVPGDYGLFVQNHLITSTRNKMHTYRGGYMLEVPNTSIDQAIEIRPMPSTQYLKNNITHRYALAYLWFENAPGIVAANAEDYFVPKLPTAPLTTKP